MVEQSRHRRKSADAVEWRHCAQCGQLFRFQKCRINNKHTRGECCSQRCAMLFRNAKRRSKQPISADAFMQNIAQFMKPIYYAMRLNKDWRGLFSNVEIESNCIAWVYEKFNDIMQCAPEKRNAYIITLCKRKISQYVKYTCLSGVLSLDDLKNIGIEPMLRKDRPDVRVFNMIDLQDAYNEIKQKAGKGVAWKIFYDFIENGTYNELEIKYKMNAHDLANKVAYCRLRLKGYEKWEHKK